MIANGSSVTNFDDISQINWISKVTVDKLRKFCESRAKDEQKNFENAEIHTFHEQNIHFDDDIWTNSFEKNDISILYDGTIAPIDFQNSGQDLNLSKTFLDKAGKTSKVIKLGLDPKLCKHASIRSFTTIDLDATSITYTRFSANGEWDNGFKIEAWNHYKIQLIGVKNLFQMHNKLSIFIEQLPESDIYILDDYVKLENFRKAVPPKRLSKIIEMNQQFAMLFTLLRNRKPCLSKEAKKPNVFFMTYNNVGRIYDLLVGREPVSTESTIKNILNNLNNNIEESAASSIPIEVDENLKNTYFRSHPVKRESLGKTMLIGLTFIRLGLLKNSAKCSWDTHVNVVDKKGGFK